MSLGRFGTLLAAAFRARIMFNQFARDTVVCIFVLYMVFDDDSKVIYK